MFFYKPCSNKKRVFCVIDIHHTIYIGGQDKSTGGYLDAKHVSHARGVRLHGISESFIER